MLRVLIADDEPRHVGGMHRLMLRLCPDAQIAEAFGGIDALRQIRACAPDMLITDIRMEDMDGIMLIESIGAELRSSMRIVVMSAYDQFEYAQQAIRLGVADYLLKPVDEAEVDRVLRTMQRNNTACLRPAQAPQDICDETIRCISDFIREHYLEDVTLERIAGRYHYNANYLSVRFKQCTGMTFSTFLRDIRLERAVCLLTRTNLRVSDVAAESGYRDTGYFIRSFRKLHGVSPEKYRRIARRAQ